jgi:hypothetical protein
MKELDKELKKLYARGAIGVSVTLRSGKIDPKQCSKEITKCLKAMKKTKCKECEGIEGNGRGAWGFCSTCQGETWSKKTCARQQYDKKTRSFATLTGKGKFAKTSLKDMKKAGKKAAEALKRI